MPFVETISGDIGEIRAISAAAGTSLTTTPAYLAIPTNTRLIFVEGRNYASSGATAQVLFNHFLVVLRTTDNLANVTDYSEQAQDGDATTEVVLDAQDVAANGDYLYVGSHMPFAGCYVDVSADANEANGTVSVLTVNYWDGSAWTTTSATDNTASGGASLAQDGTVTWTVPGGWQLRSLVDIGKVTALTPGASVPYQHDKLYWTRWQWSVQLDALTRLDAIMAINRSTAYAELVSGRVLERAITRGLYHYGSVQARMDTGTGNLVVNVATGKDGHF